MSNFEFLKQKPEFQLFSAAAIEAEKVFMTSPAMCAIGARKALELEVKWVYAADTTMEMPYQDNLSSLIHEPTFRFAVDHRTWGKLPYIIKLGNLAVHTERSISASDAVTSLRALFEFTEWVDCCYGQEYEERRFDEKLIPKKIIYVDKKKIKEQESLLEEKDSLIEELKKKVSDLSEQYTKEKEKHAKERNFTAEDPNEFLTRKKYIDLDLKSVGWKLDGNDADVWEEYEVNNMAGIIGQKGYCDYVLMGKDGRPLAVIEAKRTSKDPNTGRQQVLLYANALEEMTGQRPMMLTTNGFETYFWDDKSAPQHPVSGVFSKEDLQRLMNRRSVKKSLHEIPINDAITERYYQKEAIRAVCDQIEEGLRKFLLVMATGTGKTRTAASLVDVLSRGGYVTNVLFLADRTALVKQAKEAFQEHLPEMSLCNLCSSKDDRNARVVFSTYPTMLNSIDDVKNGDGMKLFTPAHFDLIIIDECHRSIFKKYRAIFEYFDSYLVGLTATPKMDVDRNTYDFFEMEHGVPTYAYDYETAVSVDHVLVPYYTYAVGTEFTEKGITYKNLSKEDRDRLEEDFNAEGLDVPEFIPSQKLNKFIFNTVTIDTVLQDLMERGIKVEGGDKIGKTIIFAQNKNHAEIIVQRFNALYPQYHGTFAKRVICDDSYAQTIIDDFKCPDKEPQIAVSVDMMDTGIDVPECVNLVFFKQVKSKIKFWQMIGRGTRLAPDLVCQDRIDGEYTDKRRFLIFDYCGNFKFFDEKANGFEGKETRSVEENIFIKRVDVAMELQQSDYAGTPYQDWRKDLVKVCNQQVAELNTELTSVRLQLKYVEKYKDINAFTLITETARAELVSKLAPLVHMKDRDTYAKRFDNFMYGLILAKIRGLPTYHHAVLQLNNICELLASRITIPQIKAKLDTIKALQGEEFWRSEDLVLQLDHAREDLRGLIRFIIDGRKIKPIITKLEDPVIYQEEGVTLKPAYDFEDYRKKVNRYIAEHPNTLAIYKLTHNIRLQQGDYKELERVFTQELGSKKDYEREYGDIPFGILIRRVAKMDHDAAMEAFSAFINDASLNQQQISFVNKIITHIENNGFMEVMDLTKPPFDKPKPFIKLFPMAVQKGITDKIREINDNAVELEA